MRNLILCTLFVISTACAGPESGAGVTADPLPPDGFLETWQKGGAPRLFTGADLYGHINGGAEVFLELGFERLVVQRYQADEDRIDVEIYWMSDATAALGVYLLHCGKEERIEKMPARHTAGTYQIQFARDCAYVKINNPSGGEKAGAALPHFARNVENNLPGDREYDPFARLPATDRIPGSERVIRGPFTLERICYLGTDDPLRLEGGVTALAADYPDPLDGIYTLIVAEYPGAAAARAAFSLVGKRLDNDSGMRLIDQNDKSLVFKNYSDRFGRIGRDGNTLTLFVNLSSAP